MIRRGRSPYECFKDDRARLFALMSRDARLIAIALIAAFAAPPASKALASMASLL
ncbi:hypothetical protein AB4Z46_28460 [Variovorax sp. M-6]